MKDLEAKRAANATRSVKVFYKITVQVKMGMDFELVT